MTFLSPRNPSIRRSPQAPLRAFPRGQDKRNPVTSLTIRRMPVKPRPLLGFSVFSPAFRYREASRMLKDPTTGLDDRFRLTNMARQWLPRCYENELPPRLFSHQTGIFSEVAGSVDCSRAPKFTRGVSRRIMDR